MISLKPHLNEIFRTGPSKLNRKEFLRLDMNEGFAPMPDSFIQQVLSEVDKNFLSSYPDYSEVIERLSSHNNVRPENICISNGSCAAIKYMFDAYVSEGDKVLLTDSTYAMYPVYCRMFGANVITIDYHPDLSFPYEEYLNALTHGIKMAVLVNPNNPTGSVLSDDMMLNLIKKAEECNILIVIDEAYFYFHSDTAVEFLTHFKNLAIIRTFSKLFSMASLRMGYVIADSNIINGLVKVKPSYDVNGLAVLFIRRILENPSLIKEFIKSINAGKKYLYDKLETERIPYRKCATNFILINCGERIETVVEDLSEKKILVSSGFRQDYLKGYMRVTAGTESIMERFWDSFIRIWESLQ